MADLSSQDQQTQAATQVYDEYDPEAEENTEEPDPVWGRLLPESADFDTILLQKDEYVLGRHHTCDRVFNDPVVSNRHCKIQKVPTPSQANVGAYEVFLHDSSSNGTFVNGSKLGHNKKTVLKHGDKIALSMKKRTGTAAGPAPVFLFHDTSHRDPPPADESSEIGQKYIFKERLGSGACGEVWLGVNKDTGSRCAIKKISKKRFNSLGAGPSTQDLLVEVEILRELDHPNIIRVIEMFDMDEALFIVLEIAHGGELFEKIVSKGKFTAEETRFYFIQLFHAVKYLHGRDVAHRDLKPENILLGTKDDYAVLKVTDFGLAKLVGPQSFMKTMCGTPSYQAPEVLQNQAMGYSNAVDMWSCGVILYICLCGFPPFSEEIAWHNHPLRKQILEGIYAFPSPWWDDISEDAKDLVKKLLVVDPAKRLSVTDALAHPFLDDEGAKSTVEAVMTQARSLKSKSLSVMGPPSTAPKGVKRAAPETALDPNKKGRSS